MTDERENLPRIISLLSSKRTKKRQSSCVVAERESHNIFSLNEHGEITPPCIHLSGPIFQLEPQGQADEMYIFPIAWTEKEVPS